MKLCSEIVSWTQHLGGADQIGHDDELRIERASYLTLKLREHESAILRGEEGSLTEEQYAAWVNTLHGLLKSLGPRRAKSVGNLHDYIAKRGASAPLTHQVKRAGADPVDVRSEPVASQSPSAEVVP